MRLLAFVEYAAVFFGIVGVIAGKFFAIHKGFEFGVFLVGAGFALAGLEALVTQRMGFRAADDAYHAYAGAPSMIVGVMLLFVGAAVIGSAYLLSEGLWPKAVNYLVRRPGPILASAGVLAVCTGVLMMLNPQARSGWLWRIFLYFPRVLLGVIVVAMGIAAIAGGAWEWRDPRAFQDFAQQMPRHAESAARYLRSFVQ